MTMGRLESLVTNSVYGGKYGPGQVGEDKLGNQAWVTDSGETHEMSNSGGGKGSSAPRAPNYTKAAEVQASENERLLGQQTQANRPDQINASTGGSVQWRQGPDGQWTQTTRLGGAEEAMLRNVQGTASQMSSGLGQQYGRQMDWEQFGDLGTGDSAREQAINAAYGQASSRLDPAWQQREEQMRTQLYNQGFREGDQGYDRAMQQLGQQRNDAYQGALNSAIMQGTQAQQATFGQNLQSRQQAINEALSARSQPMSELSQLMALQGKQTPQFGSFSQAGAAQAPDYMAAQQAAYNARLQNAQLGAQQSANTWNTVGNIGGALLPYALPYSF